MINVVAYLFIAAAASLYNAAYAAHCFKSGRYKAGFASGAFIALIVILSSVFIRC